MRARSSLALASLALTSALLVWAISVYEHAQRRLDRLTEVAGRNVIIVRMGDDLGYISPPGEAFLNFVRRLPGFTRHAISVSGGRRPDAFDYYAQYVSEEYFSVRRFALARGRFLRQDADEAVVGFGFRELLGRTIEVKGHRVRVVGVLASMAERGWPDSMAEETVFLPMRWARGLPTFYLEFHDESAARSAIPAVQDWLEAHDRRPYRAEPLADLYGLELRRKLRGVLGGAVLWGVLAAVLVAGANLAAFQLARALERIRELGIRRAVGASRRHVLREALRASVGWAAAGLVLGLPLAYLLGGEAEAWTGVAAPPTPFAIGLAGMALLVLSLASTLPAARWWADQPPAAAIRGLASTMPQRRLALALVALGLGLAAWMVQRQIAHSADVYTRETVGDLTPNTAVYSSFHFVGAHSLTDPRGVTQLDYEDYRALLASPLVRKLRTHAYVEAYGGPVAGPAGEAFTYVRAYEGPYPELAGARLLEGRWPRPGHREAAIGRGLAEELFGPGGALGREIVALGLNWRVVGVFAGAGEALPGNAADDQVLLPRLDLGGTLPRARGEILVEKKPRVPKEVFDAIARFLTERHASPELVPVQPFTPVDLAPELRATLLELAAAYRLLAAVILMLAAVGLGAQTAMIALLETRTLGIKRALGASRGRVYLELLAPLLQGASLAGLAGAGAGAVVSHLIVRAQEAPWAFSWPAALAVVLAAPLLAALAAALPAWRAASRPPAEAMRVE